MSTRAVPSFDAALHVDRVSGWQSRCSAGAVLDSLIAPVRSVTWLEMAIAWQGSRTAVLCLARDAGWPLMLFMGATPASSGRSSGCGCSVMSAACAQASANVSVRRCSGLRTRQACRPSPVAASRAQEAAAITAPPPYSPAHARHDVNDEEGSPVMASQDAGLQPWRRWCDPLAERRRPQQPQGRASSMTGCVHAALPSDCVTLART